MARLRRAGGGGKAPCRSTERPRSKLAKAARNKLKLTGHLDDE